MIEQKNHEEYVLAARRRAAEIAAGILSGDVAVLEGSRLLDLIRWELEVDERDPDFDVFTAIASETDALPIGPVRQHWSPEALAKLESEIQSAIAWAAPLAAPACQAIVERFGMPATT
ncbi:hypothetical protein AB4059_00405 [Lysobacter sp. 2RAF19]